MPRLPHRRFRYSRRGSCFQQGYSPSSRSKSDLGRHLYRLFYEEDGEVVFDCGSTKAVYLHWRSRETYAAAYFSYLKPSVGRKPGHYPTTKIVSFLWFNQRVCEQSRSYRCTMRSVTPHVLVTRNTYVSVPSWVPCWSTF